MADRLQIHENLMEKTMTAITMQTTQGRGRLFASILETIGNTPAIRVNNLAPTGVEIYVKAEFFNPAGSVKDRLALAIIEEAERSGALKPGQTVVEATSGNTRNWARHGSVLRRAILWS